MIKVLQGFFSFRGMLKRCCLYLAYKKNRMCLNKHIRFFYSLINKITDLNMLLKACFLNFDVRSLLLSPLTGEHAHG